MKLLLLGLSGAEPSYHAWLTSLERAGIPYEAAALGIEDPPPALVGAALARGRGAAPFQAAIFATSAAAGALPPPERRALEALEREAGLRRLIAYAAPEPTFGLAKVGWEGPLEELGARLTHDGCRVFPYLRGPLPVDPGSWCYPARPLSGQTFRILLEGGDGSVLLGIHTRSEGGEQMIQTFDANVDQAQGQLLRHGQLVWLTHGTYLGYERNHLSVEIDDVLLGNHGWSVERHLANRDPNAVVRMTASDATHAARWSRERGLRLDLACNGGGSDRFIRASDSVSDPLLEALKRKGETFGWINHTYEHRNLNAASGSVIEAEIERNLSWARRVGIDLEAGVVVTGEHTGLANTAASPPVGENDELAGALTAQRIRYLGCDASRPYPMADAGTQGLMWPAGAPFAVGSALAIPRHPTRVPFDGATEAQALDRVRAADPGGAPGSWASVIATEARRIFVALVANDPRPHYLHQSNLAGERIVYPLLDAVLDRYERYLTDEAPIAQPRLADVGELLSRWLDWRLAVGERTIRAYLDGSAVTIANASSAPVDVPVTGADVGERYAGTRSGWVRVEAGEELVVARDQDSASVAAALRRC